MKFQKFLVWLNAVVWLFFGLGYVIVPSSFASLVGSDITRIQAYKIMSDVGFMMVGIGIWYVYCAIDNSRIRYGLISAFLICFGMLVGRLIGILVTGSANNFMALYLILETLDSILLFIALCIKDESQQAVTSQN
jgi:hypothetical protein